VPAAAVATPARRENRAREVIVLSTQEPLAVC
jgi:hypothetical protein